MTFRDVFSLSQIKFINKTAILDSKEANLKALMTSFRYS